jgi:hypothetical protein
MNRLKFSWNDYFTATPVTTINPGEYTSRQVPSNSNVYILNCLFNNCTSINGSGGALCCTVVECLLIESSSFFSCKAIDGFGGAVYFSFSGQCVLHGICCYNCCAIITAGDPYGQFTWIGVKNDASSKNYVNYSSFTRCMNENTDSYNVLCHVNGKICCQSVNVSINKCYSRSGVLCQPYLDTSSVTASMSYSSFTDNIAFESMCIWFSTEAAKNQMLQYPQEQTGFS